MPAKKKAAPKSKQTDEAKRQAIKDARIASMNELAVRIWDGQSVSLPKKERLARINTALTAKGYEDILSELKVE